MKLKPYTIILICIALFLLFFLVPLTSKMEQHATDLETKLQDRADAIDRITDAIEDYVEE